MAVYVSNELGQLKKVAGLAVIGGKGSSENIKQENITIAKAQDLMYLQMYGGDKEIASDKEYEQAEEYFQY